MKSRLCAVIVSRGLDGDNRRVARIVERHGGRVREAGRQLSLAGLTISPRRSIIEAQRGAHRARRVVSFVRKG